MSRKESIKKLREQLIRRRDALHRALEGDLSLLRELHQERTGIALFPPHTHILNRARPRRRERPRTLGHAMRAYRFQYTFLNR